MSRSRIVLPLVSLVTVVAMSAAYAEPPNSPPGGNPPPGRTATPATPRQATPQAHPPAAVNPRMVHGGPPPSRVFSGHPYRGHLAWEGGRWRHEVHNGRPGWWWDTGGVWYWYPERMDGPPPYISEEYVDDAGYAPAAAYAPPPGAYPPPPGAYPPPPPPPPPDPAASAVGGAIVGGVLGGLLTGRPGGAAAGAIIGGTTGAIAGATAAARPGYWMAEGTCYYRYPSGQYVVADPRWCY
jgi:hypothetical protein